MEESLRSIDEALAEEGQEEGWGAILCPSQVVRRMLSAGLGVAFFQQISGSEAIVYYTPKILSNFGITTESGQNLGAMSVGAAKFLGACLGACFLDCVGRRIGVLVSCVGVAACLIGLAEMHGTSIPSLGLSLLCMFMVFFELGLAPAAFVLGTESYPVSIRAKALGMGMFITRFLSGLVAVAFPPIVSALSITSCLWFFAAFACLGVSWAFFCIPETMGLSLEEVTKLFEAPIQLFRAHDASMLPTDDGKAANQVDIESMPLQA
jgi:major inositol transporter-like SP family MFS transporter